LSANLNIVIKAVDKATSAIKQVASKLNVLDDSVSRVANNTGTLTDTLKTAAGVMLADLAHDSLNAVTSSAGEASDQVADLEWTLKTIVAASGEVGDAAEELYNQLNQVAHEQADLGFTSVEAAEALESLVKAGLSGAEAADALEASLKMARLEGMSTAQASDMLVGVMNQFGYAADEASKVVDILVNSSVAGVDAASDFALALSYCGGQAASMGFSLEETTAALVAINNQGIAAEKAGRYLGSMFSDLIAKSDELGFSIYNSDGSMKSLKEIVELLTKRLKKFGTQEKRNAYLNKIFGSQSARAALALLNLGDETESAADVLEELEMQMGRTGTSTDTINDLMATAKGRMAALEAQIKNANESLGQMALQVELGWKQFALALGPIGAVADALGPSLLQGAITGVMMVLPQLIMQMGGLTGVLGGVKAAFASLSAVMMANPIMLVVAAIGALVAALVVAYQTCEPFRNAVNAVGKALYDFFKPAIDAVIGALKWLWDNVLKPLAEFLAAYFMAQWEALTAALGWLNEHVIQPLTGAFEWLWNNVLTPLADFLKDYFMAQWETVGSALEWFNNNVVQPLTNAFDWLWNNVLVPLGNFIVGGFKTAWETIGNAIGWVKGVWDSFANAIKWVWDNILKPLADFLRNTLGAAIDTVTNALKPLTDTLGDVGDALGGVAGTLGNFVSGLFGSPKTVFEDAAIGIRKMRREMGKLPDFPDLPTAAAITPALPIPPAGVANITVTGPLVNIEGSADRATAELAAELVREKLQSVIIENTSANAITKRIRMREW